MVSGGWESLAVVVLVTIGALLLVNLVYRFTTVLPEHRKRDAGETGATTTPESTSPSPAQATAITLPQRRISDSGRNGAYREILVFVAHAFRPKTDIYRLDAFRNSVYTLMELVAADLRSEFPGLSLRVIVEMGEYGEQLGPLIEEQIRKCHFAFVDISENNPNVLFELGHLTERGTPYVIVKSKKSMAEYPIPSDITDRLVGFYSEISDIVQLLRTTVTDNFRKILENQSLPSEYLNKIWFPSDRRLISLICGPELEKSSFASRSAPNYIYLDNLDDKDALVEIVMFLSRLYPRTRMVRYASDNFPPGHIEGDLVVIGGPGEPDGPGNSICKQIMDKIRAKVTYSDDAEVLFCEGREYRATMDKNGYIASDYGYFARFPNPFDPTSSVILVNGIHTYGTLGASLAFTDHPSAQLNIRKIVDRLEYKGTGKLAFECFFPVSVVAGAVTVPEVEEKWVFRLG